MPSAPMRTTRSCHRGRRSPTRHATAAAAAAAAAGGAAWSWSKSGETLRHRWRRVASTHDLSDLAGDRTEERGVSTRPSRLKLACWGIGLLLISVAALVAGLFSILISKLMPQLDSPLLRIVQDDWYYCLLIPISVLATLIAVTLNWVSMKLFKHNS